MHLGVAAIGPGDVTSVYEVRAGLVTVLLANKYSYREDVAVALLDAAEQVAHVASPGAAVYVQPIEVPGCPLDRAVVLGPGGHRLLNETPELARRTIGVFALHRSEFVEDEGGAAFWSAIDNRSLRVPIAEWHRAPKPRADVRLLDDWPGGPMRRLRRPTPWSAELLMTQYVPDLARGVRLSVRDVRGFELVLERRWDRIVGTVTAPHRAATVDVDIARIRAWDTLRSLFHGEAVDLTMLGMATAEEPPETNMLELTYSTADRGYASLPRLCPLDECIARLSAHITRTAGNAAVFTSRAGVAVSIRCEEGQRLWLEVLDPARPPSHGRHVTLEEAAHLLRLLAQQERGGIEQLHNSGR
ncbi:hypothetical protein ABZS66_23965 [Dactylosporangium sp. NPDC005572]|uniref:hypothetical protein n=1 Tax=Dactylosporangium sp. NPDC005572 TaxID=3156889 RepID=UPI0033A0106A